MTNLIRGSIFSFLYLILCLSPAQAENQTPEPSQPIYNITSVPQQNYRRPRHFGLPIPQECQSREYRGFQDSHMLLPEAILQKLMGIIPRSAISNTGQFFRELTSHPLFYDYIAGVSDQVLVAISDGNGQQTSQFSDSLRTFGDGRRTRAFNNWYMQYIRKPWETVRQCTVNSNPDYQRCETSFNGYGEYYLRYHFNKSFYDVHSRRLAVEREFDQMVSPIESTELQTVINCLNEPSTDPIAILPQVPASE